MKFGIVFNDAWPNLKVLQKKMKSLAITVYEKSVIYFTKNLVKICELHWVGANITKKSPINDFWSPSLLAKAPHSAAPLGPLNVWA